MGLELKSRTETDFLFDLIKISKSGANPAKQPIIDPNKTFFLLESVCAKIAPKAP